MRRLLRPTAMAFALLAAPGLAFAQNLQVQGFGGVTVRGLGTAPTVGGNIAVPLGSHVQVIAEGGRMGDIMSPTLATLLDFAPVDLRLRADYGEGGVRILGSSHNVVRPYAEATAGLARLRTNFSGAGLQPDAISNAALQFLDTYAADVWGRDGCDDPGRTGGCRSWLPVQQDLRRKCGPIGARGRRLRGPPVQVWIGIQVLSLRALGPEPLSPSPPGRHAAG